MKIIITTIILTLFSSLSFADGHTSGKFNASGMGAWEVNAMNAGKGDMAITYDGIAGLADDTPDSIFHKSTMHCIGGLTLQAGKFTDETGMCRFDLIDGESVLYEVSRRRNWRIRWNRYFYNYKRNWKI